LVFNGLLRRVAGLRTGPGGAPGVQALVYSKSGRASQPAASILQSTCVRPNFALCDEMAMLLSFPADG
jgi:hypothetical protein